MTLHWWMHWFWVTAHFLVILGSPVPSSTADPHLQEHPVSSSEVPETEDIYRTTRQSFRIAKAIGLYPQTNTAVIPDRQATTFWQSPTVESTTEFRLTESNISNVVPLRTTSQRTVDRIRAPKKDSKITWILTTNKTGKLRAEQETETRGTGNTTEVEDLTVLPLQEEVSRFRLVLNRTRPSAALVSSSSSLSASAGASGIRTFNRSDDDVEIDEELAEPQLLATAASVLEVGVSESTRLSRARSAFTKEFQRDQVQGDEQVPDYNDSNTSDNAEENDSSTSAVDIAAITGSCVATVVLLSTMGSLGFIMYRRRYLNPPQTLNSDKCSNPDSSGYIDDSTIRDNSEEMYSLDNDSFLNSLEAMTIQNYWTDSVKHTKL